MSNPGNDGGSYPVYGSQVRRPLRVRVLQSASLVLAVAGLVLLYLYSINREIPVVKVGEIVPTMNFATVRISGEVSRSAHLFKSGGVVFTLDDGSGEIAVLGGRVQADALKTVGKLPQRGDRVEVTGSLSVSADQESKLRMQSADRLILHRRRTAPSAVTSARIRLADITRAQDGELVTVTGTLKTIGIPRPGSNAPYVLTLEEDGAELPIIFWDDVFEGLERKLPLPGSLVSARGRVDVYQGTVQIKVREAGDLRVPAHESSGLNAVPPVRRIAEISAAQKGEMVTVDGILGEPKSISGGVIYPITDESGEMKVLFWDKQVSGEERDALESGAHLRVTAPLVVYKGTLELVPADAGGFDVEAGP